jgi:hypothetical protein
VLPLIAERYPRACGYLSAFALGLARVTQRSNCWPTGRWCPGARGRRSPWFHLPGACNDHR